MSLPKTLLKVRKYNTNTVLMIVLKTQMDLMIRFYTLILTKCVDFNDVRQRFYQVPSLQDLFKTVKPEVILQFLKAAALYRLL